MKHMRLMFCVTIVLMFLLAACVPASTPTPIIMVVTATAVPVTATSPGPTAPATAAPVILAGPQMQVGSTYLYFDGALLVAVPGGPFTMGHGGSDNPEHTVTLSDFWIYSTKVTNAQYQQCVALGKCTAPDLNDNQTYTVYQRLNDPVVGVNWAQSEAYCEYASGRLPTEAQWEKTARGPNANIYPWGNNAPGNDLLNYNNFIGHTTSVVNYPKGKSYYDALDMEGNVYEWVYDWYDPLYYQSGPAQDPQGPNNGVGGNRSVRSAGYKGNVDQVVASTRSFKLPNQHARDLGFRCVVKDPTFFAPLCSLTGFVGPNLSGGASGGLTADCPVVDITVNYLGCGNNASENIHFFDNQANDTYASITNSGEVGCTGTCSGDPGGYPALCNCTNSAIPAGGIDFSIQSKCKFSSSLPATCSPHYALDFTSGKCNWDGSGTAGTACPTGTSYDPNKKCCTTTPGSATNFVVCPVGTSYMEVLPPICVPSASAGSVVPKTAHVNPYNNKCGNTGGGNPGSGTCQPPQHLVCTSGLGSPKVCVCQ